MEVRVEFLGTGTSQGIPVMACDCAVCSSMDPRDKRLRTSVSVEVGERRILIDAGPDLRQQCLRSSIRDVHAVLLTHEHMDHIAGIDELRAFNFVQQRPMDLYGSEATLHAVRRMFHYAFADVKYPGVPELRLHTIDHRAFEAAGVGVLPVEVMHHQMPVQGYRIGGFAYLTDVKTIAPVELDKLRGLDVLVLNALRIKPHLSHLNLAEALDIVADLKPRRAFFTHISHLLGAHGTVGATLPPGVELAYDGLVVHSTTA
ncbi:MAG: MBL fold metallo-hydrolase [Flavobacteriales bacterium]|nr:MBL fold metallo-hydrolase [Flavobacteriales bacterium]